MSELPKAKHDWPLDERDLFQQSLTPVVVVPKYSEIAPLSTPGHRYLVAEDGLWLEVRRAWLWARMPLAQTWGTSLPFGRLAEPQTLPEVTDGMEVDARDFMPTLQAQYTFEAEDLERLQTLFVHDARASLPDEFAAWGVWDDKAGRLVYRPLVATEASPGGITFSRPRLEDHEHLAVDLHSHGALAAFFSSTDDDDDRGEVKLSVVVGTLDQEPTFATRLCALGLFVDSE
jgi:hypothetical protein